MWLERGKGTGVRREDHARDPVCMKELGFCSEPAGKKGIGSCTEKSGLTNIAA